ncbi:FecCD family ABC transporter permease [Pontiella sulfatireligans]|uniref:Hemin transport system permease protein HmuU n=1 Tax=Pontiella sulfatireligans TaxID=2750658 RepID=A0A6C2UVD3_9BACT|nr:iron ABC transporter permease [Pontiella sulfatireligans]VGO22806.1 Hemin transport system permease protein HmuU [Pontiella sulfatireligans]
MKKPILPLLILFLLAGVALFVSPLFGMKFIPYNAAGQERDILLNIRVPRVLCAFMAGAMLSLSGMSFQALFRNPLATPFTLGVSSGAALGASIFIRLGLTFSFLGISGTSLAAFGGALLSVWLVYGLTKLKGGFSTPTLLLAGIAISFFFSSLILFIQYVSGLTHSFRIVHWMMGTVATADFGKLLNLLPFFGIGSLLLAFLHREMNLFMVGEDIAVSRGVNVGLVKKLIFLASSLMVGGVVAVCGPIGFVGMMSPHICRMLVGADHRYLMPASLLFGGLFLAFCDTLSRTLIAPAEIPVGVLTALLGGPFFIWLLLNRKGDLEL